MQIVINNLKKFNDVLEEGKQLVKDHPFLPNDGNSAIITDETVGDIEVNVDSIDITKGVIQLVFKNPHINIILDWKPSLNEIMGFLQIANKYVVDIRSLFESMGVLK